MFSGRLLLAFAARLPFDPPFLFGGVKGRNPLSCGLGLKLPSARFALFEFAGVNGRSPGLDGPRASLGDMAGTRYCSPAALAGIADRPLKSPGLAVAAIAGRP